MSTLMLLYKNVTALSRETHSALKLKASESFDFAKQTHWVPLAGVEFYPASRDYPIVFARDAQTQAVTPILLVGLKAGENDQIDASGKWRTGVYLPAFIRRYPFVLAETGADPENELAVCFDNSSDCLGEEEGHPLFNPDRTNSATLDESLRFLNDFKIEMERTKHFSDALQKLELLESRSVEIRSADGASWTVRDFLVVNEEAFGKLTGTQLAELHKNGYLGWIFAHLMSLSTLRDLFDLHRQRVAA
ncbi:SapC family protein [Cupriavidus sp. H39]|uniref:SapC family protein n=1 Tax=Cupriavidus sp. H39 TaxID=3401635 RepID=UPI003D0383D7